MCRGERYNYETLQVKYKGYSIADLLALTIEAALPVLETNPQIRPKLQTLLDVGMGYVHLGQSSTTLSGGEAQRIKLAKELSKRQTGRRFTFSTSRPPACISRICASCSKYCSGWWISAIRFW